MKLSPVHFYVPSQVINLIRCKITPVAFVCFLLSYVSSNCLPWRIYSHNGGIYLLFSTVNLHVSSQVHSLMRCKITLVAFFLSFLHCVFSCVFPIFSLINCTITHVAFFCLFYTVCYQMFLQIACHRDFIVTQVAFA